MAQSFNLKAVISAVDRVTGPMKRINAALRSPIKAMQDVVSAGRNVAGGMAGALGPAAALAGAGGLAGVVAGVGSVIRTSAEFERFSTTLEVVEGSAAKAKASLGWVSEFATKTPYSLRDVTASFVQLRSIGVDPMNGALKAAGDAAAVMNTSLDEAAGAMSAAMRGEMDPLERFGVQAETVGNKLVFRWEHLGKKMGSIVDKTNREAIAKTVSGIWNTKFGGAMEKQSQNWDGMMSNLGDSWDRFKLMIGEAGFFSAAKGQLSELMGVIEGAFKSGKAQEIATKIGGALEGALRGLKERLLSIDWEKTWAGIERFGSGVMKAVEAIGGWGNALIVLAVILNAQTIVAVMEMFGAVGRLGIALVGLGVKAVMALVPMLASFGAAMMPVIATTWAWTIALLANPITWIVLGITALIAAVVALVAGIAWAVTHWDQFKAKMAEVGDAITGAFGAALTWASEKLQAFVGWAMGVWDDIKGIFTGDGPKGGKSWKPDISFGIANQPPMQSAVAAANSNVPASAVAAANAAIPSTSGAPTPVSMGPSPALMMASGRMGGASEARVMGEVVMRFENAPQGFRVSETSSNQPGLHLRPDVGYRTMAVAG